MVEEFIDKLNNNKYISNVLYEYIKDNHSDKIPNGFNIDDYNNKVLDKLTIDNKDYFEHLYDDTSKIKLSEDQIRAVLADEKYELIVAGAGTGKTTTLVSKVKYLIDVKHVDPKKILVLSFNRKTTEELIDKINVNIGVNANISTFHSLAYKDLRLLYPDRKCVVLDKNKKEEIFLEYFRKLYLNKSKFDEIISAFSSLSFVFSKYFKENYLKYETYDDFFNAYVEHKIIEAKNRGLDDTLNNWIERQKVKDDDIRSIKGDYVKSAGEMIIANFLFKNGIDYLYEEVYDSLMDDNAVYRPDFTIDYGGEKIYIEYFGLDDESYNKIKQMKIDFHKEKHNKFISIDKIPLRALESYLDKSLQNLKIEYNPRTTEEMYEHILRLNPLSQVYPFMNNLLSAVRMMKNSPYRDTRVEMIDNYINSYPKDSSEYEQLMIQRKYILDFYNYYASAQFGGEIYYFDYTDLLYYSVKWFDHLQRKYSNYDYIIIDEYQDISELRFELIKKTASVNDASVIAVGDDWQSIYSFTGSSVEYFTHFNKYFPGAKYLYLNQVFRYGQELVDIAGAFIQKNPSQLKKDLIANKHEMPPIEYKEYVGKTVGEIEGLKELLIDINKGHPDFSILVLSRNNWLIRKILDDPFMVDDINNTVKYIDKDKGINITFDMMTVHKSKGLTYDEVIVVGYDASIPSEKTGLFWIEDVFKNKIIEEGIDFPEERRVFYVALTRTKNKVYFLVDSSNESDFVKELSSIDINDFE